MTINNIEWELVSKWIQKQTYSNEKTIIKCIHRNLSSGSKNYEQPMICINYRIRDSPTINNEHLLTCTNAYTKKKLRLDHIKLLMKAMNTLNYIKYTILHTTDAIIRRTRYLGE